jgi:hypothetical protein
MILRAGERYRCYAVAQGEERNLLTLEELFNDDFCV